MKPVYLFACTIADAEAKKRMEQINADMYLKNMRNVIMEQLTESELIVVNRCPQDLNRAGFRRAVKVQNPVAEVLFENTSFSITEKRSMNLSVARLRATSGSTWSFRQRDVTVRRRSPI